MTAPIDFASAPVQIPSNEMLPETACVDFVAPEPLPEAASRASGTSIATNAVLRAQRFVTLLLSAAGRRFRVLFQGRRSAAIPCPPPPRQGHLPGRGPGRRSGRRGASPLISARPPG